MPTRSRPIDYPALASVAEPYGPRAEELDLALSFAAFSGPARVIVSYALAQLRVAPPGSAAHLPQPELALRTGQHRTHISRAIRELVGSGVLDRAGVDHYRFIPQYEQWLTWHQADPSRRGKRRLTPDQVAQCRGLAADVAWSIREPMPRIDGRSGGRSGQVDAPSVIPMTGGDLVGGPRRG